MSARSISRICAAGILAGASRGAIAGCPVQLPVINSGFEDVSRSLAVGELTNGAGGDSVQVGTRPNYFAPPQFSETVVVTGWRTLLPPPNNPTATIRAGVMNPPTVGQGEPFLMGYNGTYVATLQNTYMQQTLPVILSPNTKYTLSFVAGFGVGTSPEAVYVSLLAVPDLETPYFANTPGAMLLAQTQGQFFLQQNEGQMLPFTLEYTSPATLPPSLQSKYIAISFIGSDGIPITNYDEFRLMSESITRLGCAGDTNNDHAVDVDDLNAILSNWLATVDECSPLDLANNDGILDVDDLNVVLTNWQSPCP